jgi:hypothetical protein
MPLLIDRGKGEIVLWPTLKLARHVGTRFDAEVRYSKKSSSIFLMWNVSSTLHPTLCCIMSLVS